MGILTNIIVALHDEVEAIGESLHPVDEWNGIELRDFDTAKIATLHIVLTGDLFDDAVVRYEPVYVSDVEGALVLRIPDEVTGRLADLDEEQLDQVAIELAATEEFESEGWGEEAIAAMLGELGELAHFADSRGQVLFVWMHPLHT